MANVAAAMWSQFKAFGLILLTIGVLTAAASIAIGLSVVGPISQLNAATGWMTEGVLDQPTGLADSKDEIGGLARVIDNLRERGLENQVA